MSADNPISRVVTVAEIPDQGSHFMLDADEAQRAALAKLLKLPAVSAFSARLHVRPFGRDGLAVSGPVSADIVQTCVVTLDDFEAHVESEVDVALTPPSDARHHRRYPEDDDGEDDTAGRGADLDAPDPLIDGAVDIGTVAVEFLALALDPYPRKPGVSFEPHEEKVERESPFAGLGRIFEEKGKGKP